MTKAITHFISHTEYRVRMIQVFMAVSAVVALMYGINLYSVISNTVALQQVQRAALALSANVSALDTTYLHLSSKITPDALHAYGLEESEVSFFISRTASLGRVALGGNEL